MTDSAQTSAPNEGAQPQPTIVIVSAAQVVAKFIERFPELAACSDSLQLVAGLYATYVKNPTGTVAFKEAVADLEDMFSADLDGVRKAIDELTRVDVESTTAFADEFEKVTGRPFNTKTLNFTGAVQEETEEQRQQEQLARELADKARSVVTRLPCKDEYNQPADKNKPRRGSLLVGFVNKAAAQVFHDSNEHETESVEPRPDWNTPPILDSKGNEEYLKIDKFLSRVLALIDKFDKQPNMRDLVLQMLANGRPAVTEADIEANIYRAFELSHQTLERTTTILAGVGQDSQRFANWVDGRKDFRAMYGSVAALFFPAK